MSTNIPMNVRDRVAASLTRYSMLLPGDKVGVAVSGGADSVTLLHVFHQLARSASPSFEIVVLHVNHRLRGLESDDDERFVRKLALDLGLPLEVQQAPIGEGNIEQLARDARRAFFQQARQRLDLRRVALGHNQSDQAETVLYRFLRGSGLAGLAGIAPVTADGLIRPMLDVTREEIRTWARQNGILWREDSSNSNPEFTRNRLRLEVFNPKLVQVLSANAVVARDEEDWWDSRVDTLFVGLATTTKLGLQFQVSAMKALHPAEQRRVIRRAICHVKSDLRSIDLAHIEGVRALLQTEAGSNRILIPGADILRSFGTVLMAKPGVIGNQPRHYRMLTELGKDLALPYDGGRLYVNWIKPNEPFCGKFGKEADTIQETADLDGNILAGVAKLGDLYIRNWEPGDEYLRTGHNKAEKIKSLFQEHRIALWERRRWPVMVLADEIVWSKRFGPSAKFQAQSESLSVLRLTYASGEFNSVPVLNESKD